MYKSIADSVATLSEVMMPMQANHYGNVHGGTILKLIDDAAFVAATRHAHKNVVLASIDHFSFRIPVHVGDILILKSRLTYVGKTSMEVTVDVETEQLKTGKKLFVGTAYMTMVAIGKNGKPVTVPGLALRTTAEKNEAKKALIRKKKRLQEERRADK
jgi:acyl-CoA hydrolase